MASSSHTSGLSPLEERVDAAGITKSKMRRKDAGRHHVTAAAPAKTEVSRSHRREQPGGP